MTNTPALTEQERKQNTLNAVWAHALSMKERCETSDSDACQYRGPDGSRCFFGALIPDELYDEMMEGQNASAVVIEYPSLEENLLERGLSIGGSFLNNLQSIHDRHFEQRFERLAEMALQSQLAVPA